VTADPKGLQYLLQTSSYNVIKSANLLERSHNLLGNSILTNEYNSHKRHRKAMLPAFGFPETKALTHIFQEKAVRVSSTFYTVFEIDLYPFQLMDMWRDEMKRLDVSSWETNIHPWVTRTALDAIGEGKHPLALL
jgi:cytochrome P450